MTRAAVADLQTDFDEAPRGFTDHLLGARDALASDELERSHAGRLFEYMGEVRGTEFHQFREPLNRNFFREMFTDVILHPAKLSDRQTAELRRSPGGDLRIF